MRLAEPGIFLNNIPIPTDVRGAEDGVVTEALIIKQGIGIPLFRITIEHAGQFVSRYTSYGECLVIKGTQVKDRPIARLNGSGIMFFLLSYKGVSVDPRDYLPAVPGKAGLDGPYNTPVEARLWSLGIGIE